MKKIFISLFYIISLVLFGTSVQAYSFPELNNAMNKFYSKLDVKYENNNKKIEKLESISKKISYIKSTRGNTLRKKESIILSFLENNISNRIKKYRNSNDENIVIIDEKSESKSKDILYIDGGISEFSRKEVLDILAKENNGNEHLVESNRISSFAVDFPLSNDKEIKLREFLKKINLEKLQNLKKIGLNNKIDCEIIVNFYNNHTSWNIDTAMCLNSNEFYSPLYISLHILEDKYFYLTIIGEGTDDNGNLDVLYNIETKDIAYIPHRLKNDEGILYSKVYYHDDIIWLKSGNDIIFSYNLKTGERYSLSHKFLNKSKQWWIKKVDGEIIVESFNYSKSINLGKSDLLPKDFFYFEINESNTKFALLKKDICEDYDNCIASIVYGDLSLNSLYNYEEFKLRYIPGETECFDNANTTFYFRDNLLITKNGCPAGLELSVFDTDKDKFLYKSNYVKNNYSLETGEEFSLRSKKPPIVIDEDYDIPFFVGGDYRKTYKDLVKGTEIKVGEFTLAGKTEKDLTLHLWFLKEKHEIFKGVYIKNLSTGKIIYNDLSRVGYIIEFDIDRLGINDNYEMYLVIDEISNYTNTVTFTFSAFTYVDGGIGSVEYLYGERIIGKISIGN